MGDSMAHKFSIARLTRVLAALLALALIAASCDAAFPVRYDSELLLWVLDGDPIDTSG